MYPSRRSGESLRALAEKDLMTGVDQDASDQAPHSLRARQIRLLRVAGQAMLRSSWI